VIWVAGDPVTQGSKVAFVSKSTGRAVMRESQPKLPLWRQKVTLAVERVVPEGALRLRFPAGKPVGVTLTFMLRRPQQHFGTGKNAGKVRDSAPLYPIGMTADIDKLTRAVLDSITDSGLWSDDGQVAWIKATKVWADPASVPGVEIMIGELKP
jgi:Holliday junction resolvase RusA-like endonuclease